MQTLALKRYMSNPQWKKSLVIDIAYTVRPTLRECKNNGCVGTIDPYNTRIEITLYCINDYYYSSTVSYTRYIHNLCGDIIESMYRCLRDYRHD